MTNRGERAAAEVIGAVFMLGLLIVLLSMLQVYAVPSESREVEFSAYQKATADLTDLRNDLLRAASTGNIFGATVETGATYPSRMILINPPTATGRLRTEAPANLTFDDVVASRSGNVRTVWNGDPHSFDTRAVRFDPAYNQLDLSPVVLAHGMAYREAETPVSLTNQPLVRGNTISVVTTTGGLDTGGVSVAATVRPVSAQTRTVTVTGEGGGPFTLTVPTNLSADFWRETILAEELDPAGAPDLPNRYVQSVEDGPTPGTVTITFEGDKQYALKLARVELSSADSDADPATLDARYLINTIDRELRTNKNGRAKLTVESRDRLNNPVSDQPVTYSASNGRFEDEDGAVLNPSNPSQAVVSTDDEGRATVYYNATGFLGTNSVNVYMDDAVNATLPAEQTVTYSVFNSVITGGGGGGDGEQAGRVLVVLDGHDGFENSGDSDIVFNIEHVGSNSVNITGYRLDYATSIGTNGKFNDGPEFIDSLQLDSKAPKTGDAYEARTPYFFPDDPAILSPGPHDLTITFDQAIGGSDNQAPGAFLQLAIYLEGDHTVTFSVHVVISSSPGPGNN